MKKVKVEADHRNITIHEAVAWTDKNCTLDDVRKRLRSRSVAFILLKHLRESVIYINTLENELTELRKGKI